MENILKTFFEIYETFPRAYNWHRFLTLKNWKRLFFDLFIKKYWLKWNETKYKNTDILRRIRMIDFLIILLKIMKYFIKITQGIF